MKKVLITSLAILSTSLVFAQKGKPKQDIPKQHIFYDTVKVVKERIDFNPDTIPVYFKALTIENEIVSETWRKGYVVWETYRKVNMGLLTSSSSYYINSTGTNINTDYYKREYEPTEFKSGTYLYEDKKTRCKCSVSMSILR